MTNGPLEEAFPICAVCLRPQDLEDGATGLVWVCECGVTPTS